MTLQFLPAELGILKQAEENGANMPALLGFLKEAAEWQAYYKEAIDIAADISGDPQYRQKLAAELLSMAQPLEKTAEGETWTDTIGNLLNNQGAKDWLGGLGQTAGNAVGIQGAGAGTGGGIIGGGGGALLGLILGNLLFPDNPMLGVLLGGLGGGTLGSLFGQGKLGDWYNQAFRGGNQGAPSAEAQPNIPPTPPNQGVETPPPAPPNPAATTPQAGPSTMLAGNPNAGENLQGVTQPKGTPAVSVPAAAGTERSTLALPGQPDPNAAVAKITGQAQNLFQNQDQAHSAVSQAVDAGKMHLDALKGQSLAKVQQNNAMTGKPLKPGQDAFSGMKNPNQDFFPKV